MSDTDPAQSPNIYRAITRRSWYDADTRKVSHAAFVLRAQDTGLSVLKVVGCSRDICLARQRDCFGEFILETTSVTNLGLRLLMTTQMHLTFQKIMPRLRTFQSNP